MDRAYQISWLLERYGGLLRGLVGVPLEQAWLVLDEPNMVIHPASPIVLNLGGTQVELWSVYLTDFTMTSGEIDIRQAPFNWNGESPFGAAWSTDASPLVASRVGRVVSAVTFLSEPANHCRGVEIQFFDGSLLVVANYFDELFLGDEVPSDFGFARTAVGRPC